jgi:hypothetical protein
MKTTEEARRGDGPRRCSEERCATPTSPVSRGRIGGEEGRGQSRVEGLGVALTGGGGRRRFKPARLAPVPGRWTTGGDEGRRAPCAPGQPVSVDKGKHRGVRRCGAAWRRRAWGRGLRQGARPAEAVAGWRLPHEAGERVAHVGCTRARGPARENEGVGPGPREIVKFSI